MDNKEKVSFGIDLVYMKTENVKQSIQNFIDQHGLQEGLLVLKYDLLPLLKDEKFFNADKGRCLLVEDLIREIEDRKEAVKTKEEKPIFQVTSVALACLAMTKAGLKPELTETKSAEVAAKFGFVSPTSGRNLKNKYNDLRDGELPSKVPKRLEKYFDEAELMLNQYPKGLEALKKMKSEYMERHGF